MSSSGPHLKTIVICYYLKVLKGEKKKHNCTTHKFFWKRLLYPKQNIGYKILSADMLVFEF